MRNWGHVGLLIMMSNSLFIGGCGNGEGVGNPAGPSGNVAGTQGRYYDMDPTHVCPSNTEYRNSISYDGTSYTYVDNCAGVETSLVEADIQASSVFAVLGYNDGIYTYRDSKPVPDDSSKTYVKVFCRSASVAKDVELFVVTGPGTTSDYGILALRPEAWTTTRADVTRSTVGSVTTYQAAGNFTVAVDTASSANAYEYNGVLSVQGESSSRSVACRVAN